MSLKRIQIKKNNKTTAAATSYVCHRVLIYSLVHLSRAEWIGGIKKDLHLFL